MNSLLTAIYNKSQEASDYKTSIEGRQYFGRKPDCADAPYVVVNSLVGTHDFYFDYEDSSDKFEDYIVQFTIVSDSESATEAGTILDDLKDVYDNTTLTVSGYSHISMKRTVTIGPEWDNEDKLYIYYVRYDVSLQKT